MKTVGTWMVPCPSAHHIYSLLCLSWKHAYISHFWSYFLMMRYHTHRFYITIKMKTVLHIIQTSTYRPVDKQVLSLTYLIKRQWNISRISLCSSHVLFQAPLLLCFENQLESTLRYFWPLRDTCISFVFSVSSKRVGANSSCGSQYTNDMMFLAM